MVVGVAKARVADSQVAKIWNRLGVIGMQMMTELGVTEWFSTFHMESEDHPSGGNVAGA